jgi:hypothetical protein
MKKMYLYLIIVSVVLSQRTLDMPLLNLRNVYYSATMLVGADKRPFNFIIDTGYRSYLSLDHQLFGLQGNNVQCALIRDYIGYMTAMRIKLVSNPVYKLHNIGIGKNMNVVYGIGAVSGEVITSGL